MKASLPAVRLVCVVVLFVGTLPIFAQYAVVKDGGALFSFGVGYEWMPDAYSSKGLCLDLSARFYTSERFFYALKGHWGTHDGGKNVKQNGSPFNIRDHRNSLLGAAGVGYEFFQSGNSLIDIYVKGLIGYGVRSARYDSYQPVGTDDGNITLGCEKRQKGVAIVTGIGVDTRFKRWTVSPSIDVLYVGKKVDLAPMVSIGYFY